VVIGAAGATGNQVLGNIIGLKADGSAALGNRHGLFIDGAPANSIGGTAAGARNVISGNTQIGVFINGSATNQILGNFIGTNVAGTAALPNAIGISISQAPNNTIGGTAAGAGNVISGNTQHGLQIIGAASIGNLVQGNFIGVNANATAALGNGNTGVLLNNSVSNTIGGLTAAARNIISGNVGDGIAIVGSATTGNLVQGNHIGTDPAGTSAIGNGVAGVLITSGAFANTIGGTVPGARNLISGNNSGVELGMAATTDNLVQGNFIGTDVNGTADLGNALSGVALGSAVGNTIGGPTTAARNIISGNNQHGVALFTGANNNIVRNNFIGVTVTGTAALGNNGSGVAIFDSLTNTISENVISGNGDDGVHLENTAPGATANNIISGNFIGTDATTTLSLPNADNGVVIAAMPGNLIGNLIPGAGNVIANNGSDGVEVGGSTAIGNQIAGNAINGNGGRGVELQDAAPDGSVTPNDTGDGDTGANNLQNFPLLTSVTTSGGLSNFSGTLNSTANTTFRIEFFANALCDATGNGEGQFFIGFVNVNTDAGGNASFNTTLPSLPTLNAGGVVTATATDAAGNTSEFSPCQCNFVIDPTEAGIAAQGVIGNTVTVVAPGGCAWTAVSNSPFITVTGGASGSGNGTVTYNVTANPGTQPRTGS
ncbi:MAG TPA: right-handed parallel beta-helix repeat-containing protein, partial [Blastocatellia bacterium]